MFILIVSITPNKKINYDQTITSVILHFFHGVLFNFFFFFGELLGGIVKFLVFLGDFKKIVSWLFWATLTLSIGGTPTYLSGNPRTLRRHRPTVHCPLSSVQYIEESLRSRRKTTITITGKYCLAIFKLFNIILRTVV